jgi:hypothetical protein
MRHNSPRGSVLLGRLARRGDAVSAFEKAMEFAPDMRETYATILAYLAVSEPDNRFANHVFHNALNQLSLEPEWKVYFGLWLRMIAGRSGSALDPDVNEVFGDLAADTIGGRRWPSSPPARSRSTRCSPRPRTPVSAPKRISTRAHAGSAAATPPAHARCSSA